MQISLFAIFPTIWGILMLFYYSQNGATNLLLSGIFALIISATMIVLDILLKIKTKNKT